MSYEEMHSRLVKLLNYLEQDPDNFALLSDACDLSLEVGNWPVAGDLSARALAIRPDDAVARYRMALVLLNSGKANESLAITAALIDSGEAESALMFAHARGLVMAHRFDEAEPLLAALLAEIDSYQSLAPLYIRTLHHLGKVEEALAFALPYLEAHPDDAVARGMTSLLHLDNGDIAAAEVCAVQALACSPSNVDAMLSAGSVALAYERGEEAKSYFDRALALQPNNGRAWSGLGLVEMLSADLPAAGMALQHAVTFMPTHLGTQNALAWTQLLRHDFAGARKTLDKSLEIDRNFSETHGTLAVLEANEGNWEQARRYAEIATRLQPESFSGRYAHSLILSHAGDQPGAQALVKSLVDHVQVPGGGNLSDAIRRWTRG